MDITVIICTFNRCGALAETLGRVAVSELPAAVEWEVLVVDNNSRDQTRQVVEEFAGRHPGRFRYLFESTPGKSFALNAGVRAARGANVVFMDDDVIVGPAWLRSLTAPLDDARWAGVGGRVLLQWTCSPPGWLAVAGQYNLAGLLAQFDLGDRGGELDRAPIGANMAFRRSMFEARGGFRTDMGPSPDREIPRPNEDTEFGRRLMAAGHRLRYEPSAVAYHGVPVERLKKEYFTGWWFDYGRAAAREVGIGSKVGPIPRCLFRVPKIIAVTLVPQGLRWLLSIDRQRRFFWKCLVWSTAGQIAENYRLSFTRGNSGCSTSQRIPAIFEPGSRNLSSNGLERE